MSAPLFQATVITLFPEMFPGPLGVSLAGKALEKGIWSLKTLNLRDFGLGPHKTVDDTPYGGGPGMVIRPDVIEAAFERILGNRPQYLGQPNRPELIYLTPRGKPFSQSQAKRLTNAGHVVLLCGRYEGIDQRVLEAWQVTEMSLGDFVLSGGEIPALAVLDACVRLLPGVMHTADSAVEESFSHGLLEYPQYTRPVVWNDQAVPDVLVSGHHGMVRTWRQQQAEEITQTRRPDLWAEFIKGNDDEHDSKD